MAQPSVSRDTAQASIDAIHEVMEEGVPFRQKSARSGKSALQIAATRLGISEMTMRNRLERAEMLYGMKVDESRYRPAKAFSFPVGDDAETPEEIIEQLASVHRRKTLSRRDLVPVHIHTPGPIAVAFVGDPHVDDPGCAWGDLKRDMDLLRETEGAFAIGLGDYRNAWPGRLARLYANQATTNDQALKLIEWLFGAAPWIALVQGNHDAFGTDLGDPVKFIHRIAAGDTLYGEPSYRLELRLPEGPTARLHVRHDFPGKSQFNAAHGLVRQTLFDYRDHMLACGDRHHAGYSPVWHNHPEPMLCHAMRVGTYKDFDHYAREKGFKEENWARSMVAIIDPRFAHDPVEFITVRFSVPAGMRELRARRADWAAEAVRPAAEPIETSRRERKAKRRATA